MQDLVRKSSSPLTVFLAVVIQYKHFLVPLAILGLVAVLVVPMPPFMLDVLLSFNISLAAIILLTTVYMSEPLEFSVFPALLLGTTLFRLVLNIASTRLILSADATTPAEAAGVAGEVIEAFGTFVAGSSLVVGVIIFLILIIVQFVVITKGATRMSEVAARFTLDAMPGKQMAIDADLSAGLIDEKEARLRRTTIMREADFYGAMDGASKFVRGDAIAGIIITLVNILGGFAIGMFYKGWSFGASVDVFTKLTIGDGLASQIPSFIIAVAAGLIVARSGERQRLGDAIPEQLTSQPVALFMVSGFLALLAFTPLPSFPLLVASGLLASIGYLQWRGTKQQEIEANVSEAVSDQSATEEKVEMLLDVDPLEVEIGYGLVPMVDAASGGDLLDRISMVRRQLAVELGIVMPPIRIRDNMQLGPNLYRVKLRGAEIGEGTAYPNLLMAMDSGVTTGAIDGISEREPAFGLPAIWIEPQAKPRAEMLGYTVVDPTSVMATHVTELVKAHADELLSREEVNHLLDQLRKRTPKLVEEAVPAVVTTSQLQKVLQGLLQERVPIRDLETIVETLADWAPQTKDIVVLTEYARHALRRTISAQWAEVDAEGKARLFVVTMDPSLEEQIGGYIDRSNAGTSLNMPPALAAAIARSVYEASESLVRDGHQLIVLASPAVRAQVKQILDAHLPGSSVLAYNEIVKGLDVESFGLVQVAAAETATPNQAGAAVDVA
ncbi:MAG: flagellar biosynthesis protein FlhA [Phycisphaerales bacterium]|nr:flagellar biosynthesis protein FlhA [Phycisphaerales bacterium]